MTALARLCVYRFGSPAAFDGGLVAATERMEAADDGHLLDALFVARDEASDAVVAIDMGGAAADGTFASLLDFRLDPGRRVAIGRRTLAARSRGAAPQLIEHIGATLDEHGAILVVLHRGAAPTLLDAAVQRAQGTALGDEAVDAWTIDQVAANVSRIVAGRSPDPDDAGR